MQKIVDEIHLHPRDPKCNKSVEQLAFSSEVYCNIFITE